MGGSGRQGRLMRVRGWQGSCVIRAQDTKPTATRRDNARGDRGGGTGEAHDRSGGWATTVRRRGLSTIWQIIALSLLKLLRVQREPPFVGLAIYRRAPFGIHLYEKLKNARLSNNVSCLSNVRPKNESLNGGARTNFR